MRKGARGGEGPRTPSKYAAKKAALERGALDPFKFKEVEPLLYAVRATISHIYLSKGCMFLRTEDGESLYLNINVLRRTHNVDDVSVGSILLCDIESHPQGKSPRVRHVVEIVP